MQTNETETEQTPQEEPTPKTGRASYSPESNNLYLYVGRVPRDEFLKLRAAGWRTLHKQREAGGGDFVATWTPSRVRTCLEYADLIEDEDMSPQERAADRAERFGGYRDKREGEAVGHADRYDAGPQAHGYQSQARADRSVRRHDRQAGYAVDAWSKAEYWQHRTAGVIRHALYKSTPGVRMGRIKEIEAHLRRYAAAFEKSKQIWDCWKDVQAIEDQEKQTKAARLLAGNCNLSSEYMHPRIETVTNARIKEHPTSIYTLLTMVESGYGSNDITGAEACALFFSDNSEPNPEGGAWSTHYRMRLQYENQMLAAAGGMLEQFEVLPGGKLGGKLIIKVSKSSATKRTTSCDVLGPKVSGWTYKAANIPGTEFAAYKFDLERISPGNYTPPTPESLAELAKFNADRKAQAPKANKPPLINPTDADAERLQAAINEREKARHCAKYLETYGNDYAKDFEPAKVYRITQAQYSAVSKGGYARAETRNLHRDAKPADRFTGMYASARQERAKLGPPVCQIRVTRSGKCLGGHIDTVIILTDKPQKPFPAEVWEKYEAPAEAAETGERSYAGRDSRGLSYTVNG